jgi:hypothetical protein
MKRLGCVALLGVGIACGRPDSRISAPSKANIFSTDSPSACRLKGYSFSGDTRMEIRHDQGDIYPAIRVNSKGDHAEIFSIHEPLGIEDKYVPREHGFKPASLFGQPLRLLTWRRGETFIAAGDVALFVCTCPKSVYLHVSVVAQTEAELDRRIGLLQLVAPLCESH